VAACTDDDISLEKNILLTSELAKQAGGVKQELRKSHLLGWSFAAAVLHSGINK